MNGNEWFNFTLGWAKEGPDLDTVLFVFSRLRDVAVRLNGTEVFVEDVTCDKHGVVYLNGTTVNEGTLIVVPLAGCHITIL